MSKDAETILLPCRRIFSRENADLSVTPEILTALNIGRRYWGADVNCIPETSSHCSIIRSYAGSIRDMASRGVGLLMLGDNSLGKTYAASAILIAAVRKWLTAYAITADELKVVYIERPDDAIRGPIHKTMETVDFLLIDDLGKEYSGKGSGWAELCFENLIRKRTRELLPTIVTSNLSVDKFRERYGKSVFAISKESMITVPFDGVDMRDIISRKIR